MEKLRVEDRLTRVAALFLQGIKSPTEISKRLGIGKGQVSKDFTVLRKEWATTRKGEYDQALKEQLARLDHLSGTAWDAYERSCKEREIATQEKVEGLGKSGDGSRRKGVMRREGRDGDSRFLKIVMDCIRERSSILGLHKLNLMGEAGTTFKVYIGDWTDEVL